MYNGEVIKQLLVQRGMQNDDLLKYLNVKGNHSIHQLTHGNPTARKLEKIADFFNVPIDVFFKRGHEYSKSVFVKETEGAHYQDRIRLLEQLLVEKEKRILMLEKILEENNIEVIGRYSDDD